MFYFIFLIVNIDLSPGAPWEYMGNAFPEKMSAIMPGGTSTVGGFLSGGIYSTNVMLQNNEMLIFISFIYF